MSKSFITKLFVGGFIAAVIGDVLVLVAALSAIARGVISLGGPYLIQFNGWTIDGTLIGIVALGGLAISVGTVLTLVSWVGALLNTYQLEDKMWFAILLVLGVLSFGFVAMVAYLVAGPDGTKQVAAGPSLKGQPAG